LDKIYVSTLIFILALLLSLAAGLTAVKADSTSDFSFASGFRINSPINRTYTSRSLILNASFGSLVGSIINHSLSYSLDGKYMGAIPIVAHYPDYLSFQGFFTGTVSLPELAEGSHTITVYAEHNIYNFYTNGIFHSRITQLDNATVRFNINDIIPVEPQTVKAAAEPNVSIEVTYGSFTTYVNQRVELTATISGWTPPYTYQWYTVFMPQDLLDRGFPFLPDGRVVRVEVPGANSSRFEFVESTPGTYNINLEVIDSAGNDLIVSSSSFIVVLPLPSPPQALNIAFLSSENKTYLANNIPLNFTVDNPISQIAYSLDSQENVTIAGNTTIGGLSNGLHNVTVYVNDTYGNTGKSETINFTIAEPLKTESFPTAIIAAVSAAVAVVVVAGLSVYFKKRKISNLQSGEIASSLN